MKSRSFDMKHASAEKKKQNKIDDFVGLYKTAVESNKNNGISSMPNTISSKESIRPISETKSKQFLKKKKINNPVNMSQINIDGSSLSTSFGGNTPDNEFKITSTPNQNTKNTDQSIKVKSLMKNAPAVDDETDGSENLIINKSKKRNKSVSFMLDDNKEVVTKKVKSEEVVTKNKNDNGKNSKSKIFRKSKKDSEKENKSDINQNTDKVSKHKVKLHKGQTEENGSKESNSNSVEKHTIKKIAKKVKREVDNPQEGDILQGESHNEQIKKLKKLKKKETKQLDDGEPVSKARKTDVKPEVIAEDLENLSIGDNAYKLSGLLDEMTVADKNKRKKAKPKRKEKAMSTEPPTHDEKEKVKWKKRKWNKDKKGDIDSESLETSVIVENLPISIILTYKKILAEHFEKCGLIRNIGVAEVYPTEESKPVLATTINFYSDGAATQALEQNNCILEGSPIRVKRPLPPTETTVVLRTYSELNEQNIASLFTGVGKIRNIRHLVKGKKSMSTAFVEFDGPETVERALRQAENARISGKRVHLNRYEIRNIKPKAEGDEQNDHTPNK